MDITLYFCDKTRAIRVRWLLEELQTAYKIEYIDIFSGAGQTEEYRQIHPYGQVPAINIDGTVIFESAAICSVLVDKFPDKQLAPEFDSVAHALYQQWMFFAPATLEPPIFQYQLHSSILPTERRVIEIAEWNLKSFRSVLITLEKLFKKTMRNSQYLINNHFSCADIMISSVLFWAPEIVVKYPNLHRYTENLKSREAYQRALQETER